MIYRIRHTTTYSYSEPALLAYNVVHGIPRNSARQTLREVNIRSRPLPASRLEFNDYFGNAAVFLAYCEPHARQELSVESVVEVNPPQPPAPLMTQAWETVRDALLNPVLLGRDDPAEFLFESAHVSTGEEYRRYALISFTPGRPIIDAALELTQRIHEEFEYQPQSTSIHTPVEEVFELRRGVCQDFAHVQLSMLRSVGLAARYVSGYILNQPANKADKLRGADASHAWIEVYDPLNGWIGLDPTNNKFALEEHIVVAWGRDFSDVSPMKGIVQGGGTQSLFVEVEVVLST